MAAHQVRQVDDPEQLLGLRDDWNRLLAATPAPSFFQALDWLVVYWRHFGGNQRLRTLVVSRDSRPTGIVPLAVRREPTRLGPLVVLGYPLDHWGTTFGPIGAEPRQTLAAALNWLQQQPRDWDLLELGWSAGPLADATARALRQAGLPAVKIPSGELSWIDMSDGWTAYWTGRNARLRNNIRRCERRLATLGRVASIHYQPQHGDPRWDLYTQCEDVAAQSWQARSTTGNTLSSHSVQPFLWDMHDVASQLGCASINLLILNDRPIAFSYDYVFRDRIYGLRTGFVPEFAHTGPGSVLLARSLQAYSRRGTWTIDLGETHSDYKVRWRTKADTSFKFCHYPRLAWRAQARCWKNRLFANRTITISSTTAPVTGR